MAKVWKVIYKYRECDETWLYVRSYQIARNNVIWVLGRPDTQYAYIKKEVR